MPKPVVNYSATGQRAVVLWAMAMLGWMEPQAIVEAAARAGYDVSDVVPAKPGDLAAGLPMAA